MLSSRAVLIVDAGGIQIVEMLIESWEFLNKIVMAYLSLFKVEHGSMISNLISLRIRIATPPPCLLSFVFSLSSLVYIEFTLKIVASKLAHSHVSTQDTLVREPGSAQGTSACEHVSTESMLAREHVSTQRTLAREYVFNTQGTQFSRLQKL